MKKLLEYLLCSIVNYPKELLITERGERNHLQLIIKAHPDDLKIIIGKNGETIKAIREVVKIKGIKRGKIINIKIEE